MIPIPRASEPQSILAGARRSVPSRIGRIGRIAPAALAVTFLAAGAVRTSTAQDGAPPAPPAPPVTDAPAPAAPDAEDAARLYESLSALQSGIRVRPTPDGIRTAADPDKARSEYTAARQRWEADVERLARTGDTYLAAAGAGPDPRAMYWTALGYASWADVQAASIARDSRVRAADLAAKAIGAAPKDAPWLGEAHILRGKMLCFAMADDPGLVEAAATHLATGAEAMSADRRPEAAGDALAWAMRALLQAERGAEARALAGRFDDFRGDFGVHAKHLRELAAQASTGVGAAFPALGESADAEGRPLRWKDLAGKPFVVHFFHSGWPNGYPAEERDVETVLRPLWDELKGSVPFVGVAMDLEMTRVRADEVAANFDDWGVKHKVQDGSAATVAAYAESQGIAWPYLRSGKWIDDPVSSALGGCGKNEAYAIVVGADGKIAWRGRAPFTALPDVVRKLASK